MAISTYGDISPRTAAKAAARMLERGISKKLSEKYGIPYQLGQNETKSVKFRRYEALPAATTPLVEGVTPVGSKPTFTDYQATLQQFGDHVKPTDVIKDTHEDPVFKEYQEVLGEQAAETVELVRLGVLTAGTNVFYSGSVASRALVATALVANDQAKVTRAFLRNKASMLSSIISSTPAFNTTPVEAGYFAMIHVDLEQDVRGMTDFIPTAEYGSMTTQESELGAVTTVRYVMSDLLLPWKGVGVAVGATGLVSEDSVLVDVYPSLYFAKNSFQSVTLAGKNALTVRVKNPEISDSDPHAQRGIISWTTYTATVITNELWMARVESGATELV